MAALPQFTYIVALSVIFSFLSAFGIGANDVAGSFATSVASGSLKYWQAILIASVMEFLGAFLLGSKVADTMRGGIVDVNRFEKHPDVLMLLMMCALIGSTCWLLLATRHGLPVSTTHTIIGGVIGASIAATGFSGPKWGWDGIARIVASWFISPLVAGILAASCFLIIKYSTLRRRRSVQIGLVLMPFWFGFTTAILTLVVVWKGSPALKLDKLPTSTILAAVFGVAGTVTLVVTLTLCPFLYRKVILEDRLLRWYHIVQGPFVLYRGPVEPFPNEADLVETSGAKKDNEQEECFSCAKCSLHCPRKDEEQADSVETDDGSAARDLALTETIPFWRRPIFLRFWLYLKRTVFRGILSTDACASKSETAVRISDQSESFDQKTETLFSSLQVLTAAVASFAHGSNDVANAIAPLASVVLIWESGKLSAKAPVPLWTLGMGGAGIVIGLAIYGHKVMASLGNNLTRISPSRGFCMELGAAITVVIASQLSLPVSTTQSITGATIAVGLCEGRLDSVNWRMMGKIYLGWIMTLPVAALVSGLLMAFVGYSPQIVR